MSKKINIVSFDVPFPADYGGVIDVFYKLKALHNKGFAITLHCFQYGRNQQEILNSLCEKVYYYKRKRKVSDAFSKIPFIVKTRNNKDLLKNLLANNHPIFFEGLHCCSFLDHPKLKNRRKFVRLHNNETKYYANLAKGEYNLLKRLYFNVESKKLEAFTKSLKHAELSFSISDVEQEHFSKLGLNVVHLPVFHSAEKVNIRQGKGDYNLYHGNLSVNENLIAVKFLLKLYKENEDFLPLVIAGKNPPFYLKNEIEEISNVKLVENPNEEKLQKIIAAAHINLLPSNQQTGTKLKLLNALHNGKFCLVNQKMIGNAAFKNITTIANSTEEWVLKIIELQNENFTKQLIDNRKAILEKAFSNNKSVEIIIQHLTAAQQQ